MNKKICGWKIFSFTTTKAKQRPATNNNQQLTMTNDKQRPTTNKDHWQTMTSDKQRPKTNANGHPDGPASCKWSSWWTGLLQMIIQMDWPLENDHPDRPASCKWSSGLISLLQMIDRIEWSLANYHLDINLLFLLCSSFPPQTQNSKFKNHRAVYS